jgi:tetratricopeptide (TPR) repeat protein
MSACNKTHYFASAACMLMLLALMAGCAPLPRPTEPTLPEPPTALPPEAPDAIESLEPRHNASLQLTDQARVLLKQERYDDAIRALERALSLYPRNGQSYYYMAEAWLEKGNFSQAAEYNRLAEMYLEDSAWGARIGKQRREIETGIPSPE